VMIKSDVNRRSTRWIDFMMSIAEQIEISGSTSHKITPHSISTEHITSHHITSHHITYPAPCTLHTSPVLQCQHLVPQPCCFRRQTDRSEIIRIRVTASQPSAHDRVDAVTPQYQVRRHLLDTRGVMIIRDRHRHSTNFVHTYALAA
jgi:hypothetical protein